MLVSFSVSNFRSFCSEQTFSLVASKRFSGSHETHAVPIPGSNEQVLRTGVVYGANGAGKSNLFKALRYVERLIYKPRNKNSGTSRDPFLFGTTKEEPSSFDVQFIAADKLYRYGLCVEDTRVTKEWLVQIIGSKERYIFERITEPDGKVTVNVASNLPDASEKLKALATVGGLQNQPFLATVNATLAPEDCGSDIRSVIRWWNELTLIMPSAAYGPLGHKLSKEPEFLTFAGDFLKAASTGVDHLSIEKQEISTEDLNVSVLPLGEGMELIVERGEGSRYYRISIQAAHEHHSGSVVKLDLDQESDGTRRLLNLLPALFHLRNSSGVYFIDEIDRSLHPILISNFLKSFLQSCEGGYRQIIVTTHESHLLSLDLLRRDEIWFAEKDNSGATQLYSLSDFSVRKDLGIRKHYLQGRFGAIPFLGSTDDLASDEDAQK